jgi:DNA-binding HxlR family transcriptional regulator
MARASELLGDRWSLLILREAFYGVTRFEDLRADLDAPRAVLSERLARLVDAGIITRDPYREPGRRLRHEYRLTAKGRELALVLLALMQWGDQYLRDDSPRLKIIDRNTGERLTVALVTRSGRIAPLENVHVVPSKSK